MLELKVQLGGEEIIKPPDLTEQQRENRLYSMFRVNPGNEEDLELIKRKMAAVVKPEKPGEPPRFDEDWLRRLEAGAERDSIRTERVMMNHFKYDPLQIKRGEWERRDFEEAIRAIQAERCSEYYNGLAQKIDPFNPVKGRAEVRLGDQERLSEILQEGRPVILTGFPLIGRKSLWYSLAHNYDGALFISADMDYKHQVAEFIAQEEPKDTSLLIRQEKDRILEEISSRNIDPLEYLHNYLTAQQKTLLLGFNFLERAIKLYPKVLDDIASLRKKAPRFHMALILEHSPSLSNIVKQKLLGFEKYFPSALTQEEVAFLARKPLEDTPIEFTDEAAQKIWEASGGRPHEVNLILKGLWSVLSDARILKTIYTPEDVKAIIDKPLEELHSLFGHVGGSFTNPIDYHQRNYKERLSSNEQSLVRQLLAKGKIPVSELEEERAQLLTDFTLVRKEGGFYQINGDLFARVIREKILEEK